VISIQLLVDVGNTESESLSKLMIKVMATCRRTVPLLPVGHTDERNGKALNSHFFDEEILFEGLL
jgi:hypothetical protein